MKAKERIVLGVVISVLILGGAALGFSLRGRGSPELPSPHPQSSTVVTPASQPLAPVNDATPTATASTPPIQSDSAVPKESRAEAPKERFIEEELADAGEDPGAVYYMSRVREAIAEGNPSFGQELLRQMKEQHSESVLAAEAELLFQANQEERRGR